MRALRGEELKLNFCGYQLVLSCPFCTILCISHIFARFRLTLSSCLHIFSMMTLLAARDLGVALNESELEPRYPLSLDAQWKDLHNGDVDTGFDAFKDPLQPFSRFKSSKNSVGAEFLSREYTSDNVHGSEVVVYGPCGGSLLSFSVLHSRTETTRGVDIKHTESPLDLKMMPSLESVSFPHKSSLSRSPLSPLATPSTYQLNHNQDQLAHIKTTLFNHHVSF